MDIFSLQNKNALVTGGIGLLGRQHAIALAESGATVVITDLNHQAAEEVAAELTKEKWGRFLGRKMDVTSSESVNDTFEWCKSELGGIQILVNNAAIDPKVSEAGQVVEATRFENFPMEQWNLQLDVGLKGAFLCSQVFGHWMAENGGGVILNISSDLSVIAPDQRIYRKEGLSENQQPVKPVTYSVIKSALVGMTKYLSTYWATQNVRVNALSPGGVYINQPEEFVKKLTNLIPMGRMAELEEYRGSVQYLCSDASKYMTGQNIVIDGGRSVL
jgi:NAD(P)-dependent dehydrogenase (short-subunit alcohol dehydrogenase family)